MVLGCFCAVSVRGGVQGKVSGLFLSALVLDGFAWFWAVSLLLLCWFWVLCGYLLIVEGSLLLSVARCCCFMLSGVLFFIYIYIYRYMYIYIYIYTYIYIYIT